MSTVRIAPKHPMNPIPNIHPQKPGVLPADLKTAAHLKSAIKDQLKLVRFGQPLAPKDSPKLVASGNTFKWVAPNGNKLIRVQLSDKPPAGSADMQSQSALVDPKTNKFYELTSGGITGMKFFHGPLALPAGTQFKGKSFTDADIAKLEKAAAKPAKPSVKLPTAAQIKSAMGAYQFHHMLNYTGTKVKEPVVASIPLKGFPTGPDAYRYTAHVLSGNRVYIERSGGLVGKPTYSNVINLNAIPK